MMAAGWKVSDWDLSACPPPVPVQQREESGVESIGDIETERVKDYGDKKRDAERKNETDRCRGKERAKNLTSEE